jgi:hypothetical protein
MIQIGIQTDQGFIAFCPPGADGKTVVLEYRPTQGSYETISLTGLEEAITAIVQQCLAASGSGGTTPTPPVQEYPFGIPPSESADYVQNIKNALVSQGTNINGPCGAFEIIRNVAMGLRNIGCGLLYKPSGNNCQERSTDVVAYRDYSHGGTRIVDCLGDAGGQNNAMWQEKGPEVDRGRWRDAAGHLDFWRREHDA